MSEEERRKRMILGIERTISHYEKEALNHARTIIGEASGKMGLMYGVIIALVLGIFGNMIAQYFYLVLETRARSKC